MRLSELEERRSVPNGHGQTECSDPVLRGRSVERFLDDHGKEFDVGVIELSDDGHVSDVDQEEKVLARLRAVALGGSGQQVDVTRSPGAVVVTFVHGWHHRAKVCDNNLACFRRVLQALSESDPRPVYGVYAPIACESGVAAFGRDPDSSKQVWSADEGYPGDFWYRDFYRDIGFDLDYDYVRPYLPPTGQRIHTGLKYHRITGKTDQKEPYDPERARSRVQEHADHFVETRLGQVAWLARQMERPPIVVCPYDAELFGHWWFEGPWWLEMVFRRLAETPDLEAVTPGDDLARHPTIQRATPATSTWGWKGYNEVWLSGSNDWIYRHLHAAADRLHALCRRYPSADERTRRVLTQALRELLLAQASDWAFMMSRDTTVEYAVRRTKDHLLRCQRLCAEVEQGSIDELRLAALEDTDNLFPALDYRVLL